MEFSGEINFLMRWLHVISGVMWIGLLWYFNFVQIPTMPKVPDELKPAVGKYIAPEALFWFRWGAMATLITGLVLALGLIDAGQFVARIGVGIVDGKGGLKGNTLRIKPPMCITQDDADFIADCLDEVLGEMNAEQTT